jgi:hypothetical protein
MWGLTNSVPYFLVYCHKKQENFSLFVALWLCVRYFFGCGCTSLVALVTSFTLVHFTWRVTNG